MAPSLHGTETDFGIRALLGPTNTGKTHRAVERMLEHASGMIGLPLRLLAREIYDRVVVLRGADQVALVTGEEKRVPKGARYWVCTVEAMPLTVDVDFLAVDEIQMMGHRQRGHVFTDRLLHARGEKETWFMGSQTARDLVADLVPTAHFDRLTRLSQLRHAKPVSVGALRPRSAVVAFSAAEVYELAERIRARRGGAAVVLGALSPRARNAQVDLYQSGEVDFMVATDAIGMGLNMDIDHVVFAGTEKFDGEARRPLHVHELAQIAGRAGRNQRDGTFGVLTGAEELSPNTIHALEHHAFAPLRRAYWRNSDLDFSSLDALQSSLRRRLPEHRPLRAAPLADDQAVLEKLVARAEVQQRARGRARVELLWEVCQVPDFRKLMFGQHAELLEALYIQLTGPRERIDPAWMGEQIERIDDVDGSIDLLMTRMAYIRTWTYVAGRSDWVPDATAWRQRTQRIEDRLSDALHQSLVARFVDAGTRGAGFGAAPAQARSASKTPRPKGAAKRALPLDAANPFSKLAAMRDAMAGSAAPDPERAWVQRFCEAGDASLAFSREGTLTWEGRSVARLVRNTHVAQPNLELLDSDLGVDAEARVRRRARAYFESWRRSMWGSLVIDESGSSKLDADLGGWLYALRRGLGTVSLDLLGLDAKRLSSTTRAQLRARGVHIGTRFAYAKGALRPDRLSVRWTLVSVHGGPGLRAPRHLGARTLPPIEGLGAESHLCLGYVLAGAPADDWDREPEPQAQARAIRVDAYERAYRQLQGAVGTDLTDGRATDALRDRLAKTLGPSNDEPQSAEAVSRVFGFRVHEGRLLAPRKPERDGRGRGRGRKRGRSRRRR